MFSGALPKVPMWQTVSQVVMGPCTMGGSSSPTLTSSHQRVCLPRTGSFAVHAIDSGHLLRRIHELRRLSDFAQIQGSAAVRDGHLVAHA